MGFAVRPSIRVYLLALILAVAFPIFAVLLWGFWQELARERHEARELALRIAHSIADDIRTSNDRSASLLTRMADRPKIRAAEAGNCDSLFPIVDFFPQYLNLQLYDSSGTLLCSAVPQPADAAYSRDAEAWTAVLLRRQRLLPRDPVLLPTQGRWISVALRKVNDRGRGTGTLALIQYIDLNVDAYPRGTVVTIVDRDGRVVARSLDSARWMGRNVRDAEIARLVLGAPEGRLEHAGLDGQVRQYGFTMIPNTEWHLYVGIPTGVAMASVRNLIIRGIIVGLIVLTAVVALSLRVSRSIEHPLEELAAAVKHLEDAGYTSFVPAAGPREVAVVGEAFNRMVARRAEAEEALVESRNQLEALSKRLVDIQEEERARIAREIHDELGQLLTALKMDVGGLIDAMRDRRADLGPMIARIRSALDETVSSIHRIAAELRPAVLDDFGFLAAIEADVHAFEERTGIECDLSLPLGPFSLPPAIETAAYRIVQEAMTNIARHANASRAEIRFRVSNGEILIDVRDDGRGLSPSDMERRAALGIAGMRERARQIGGTVDIEGIPGKGTIVSLRIPIGPRKAIA